MSIVGKLGGIEGQQTISEVVTPGGGSGESGNVVKIIDTTAEDSKYTLDITAADLMERLNTKGVVTSIIEGYDSTYVRGLIVCGIASGTPVHYLFTHIDADPTFGFTNVSIYTASELDEKPYYELTD